MVAIFFSFYFLWNINKVAIIVIVILLLIIFIKLIHKDLANRAAIKHVQHLIKINKDELLALDGKYYHFDDGIKYKPHEHYYANDMDIFGRASLFQFFNRTTSEFGAEKLATWLLNPTEKETILLRQEAVKELASKNEWHQNLQAIGRAAAYAL